MIVNKRLGKSLFQVCLKKPITCQIAKIWNRDRVGNRDWVGFGRNGSACYSDDILFPFPPLRFKENTNELCALREKEKGDWRKLSIEEKKVLYRASFRQTLVECSAPTGEWKSAVGIALVFISLGFWLALINKTYLYDPLPHTFSEEFRAAMLRRMLDLKYGFVRGVASKWDYESDDWK